MGPSVKHRNFFIIAKSFLICFVKISIAKPNLLLVISMDGFRYDYPTRLPGQLPSFDFFKNQGVVAPRGIRPSFISKTFPNHFSIATGLNVEAHGIIANQFFDPHLNASFSTKEKDSKFWRQNDAIYPIWLLNQRICPECRSGGVFWPGIETDYTDKGKAYRSIPFDKTLSPKRRIDLILKWFLEKDDPINFAMLYLPGADHEGHLFGPDSTDVEKAILAMEEALAYLLNQLKLLDLVKRMNMIVLSDHGMARVDKVVDLEEVSDPRFYRTFGTSPAKLIYPEPGINIDQLRNNFTNHHPNVTIFRKDEIPSNYHYRNNGRIPPLLALADPGYAVVFGSKEKMKYSKRNGDHGYLHTLPEMHAIFLAMGPAFKSGVQIKRVPLIIDVYPLMATILSQGYPNFNQPKVNGTLDSFRDILDILDTDTFSTSSSFVVKYDYVILTYCLFLKPILSFIDL